MSDFNKNEFNLKTRKYFEEGLMKKIYETEEFVLCNVANQVYLLFPHRYLDYGIVINKNNLGNCINNYREIIVALTKTDEKVFNANTVIINEKFYKFAKEMKAKNDIEGPSPYVDLELEQKVMDIYGNRGRSK